MIDIPTVLEAVKTQFENDTTLSSYVRSVDYGDYELEVVEKGIFPSIGLNIYDVRVEATPGMNIKHYTRYIMPLVIMFSCKEPTKKKALYGDATTKGCSQMLADIDAAIRADQSFGLTGIVNTNFNPDYASDAFKHIDGSEWVGQGMLIYELYSDEYVVQY